MTTSSIDLPVFEDASAGDLTVMALALAGRDRTLDDLPRQAPELLGSGYAETHIPIIEAVAGIAAQVLYRTAKLPEAMVAYALEWLGITRKDASASSVDLFMDGDDNQNVTLVAGTVLMGGRVPFEVARTVVVPAGAVAFGPVPVRAMLRGPVGNVLPNSTWALVSPVLVKNLQNPQPGQGGANAQTEAEFVKFASAVFGAWGTSSRAGDVAALAQFIPGIERVLPLEHTLLTNGARWGSFSWGAQPWGNARVMRNREGVMTIVARAYGGGYLTTELQQRIQTALAPTLVAGTRLVVTSPEEVRVDVMVTVQIDPVYSPAAVLSAVTQAVRKLLSGSTWAWGRTLNLADLRTAALVEGVIGVVNVGMDLPDEVTDLYDVGILAGLPHSVTPRYPNVLFVAGNVTAAT